MTRSISQTDRFSVGDLVVLTEAAARGQYKGVVFRVTRIMPVNIAVEPVNGGRGVKGSPALFEPAPADAAATAVEAPSYAPLSCGEVVMVSGPGWKQPAHLLYVVLNQAADGRCKIALLGGDRDKFWPRIPRAYLTSVRVETKVVGPTTSTKVVA